MEFQIVSNGVRAITANLLTYLNDPVFWLAIVIGLVVGSFLNVCAIRIPQKTFLSSSRSICPNCKTPIPMYFNIPVLSFVLLRGKARCCGSRISWVYPLVELGTAIIFAALFVSTPFATLQNGVLEWKISQLIRFSHNAVLSSVLIVCTVTDLKQMIIPDRLSIPMIVLGPIFSLWHPELSLQDSLFGVLIGGGVLYVVAWTYFLVRKQIGLGFGDVKLSAAIGGWLGWQGVFPTILVGSIAGSLVGIGCLVAKRSLNLKLALPFGPFLAFGAIMHIICGSALHRIFGY